MPWLQESERGLLVAIDRARSLGRTVLLVDNTPDKLVDTFYAYQAAQILEVKKMVLVLDSFDLLQMVVPHWLHVEVRAAQRDVPMALHTHRPV